MVKGSSEDNHVKDNMSALSNKTPGQWIPGYSLAAAAVAAGFGLRFALTAWVGPGLPTYITFYPAVMSVALIAGLGPGLLATALTIVVVSFWVIDPAGTMHPMSPVYLLGQMLFAFMGIFLSITADLYRRRRDSALAYEREAEMRNALREKEFLSNLLRQSSQPFFVSYPDGRFGLVNRAFEQLTGYSADEIHSLDRVAVLTPPECHGVENRIMEELHRTGGPIAYETEYVRKDGSKMPVEVLLHLMRNHDGNPEYYYSFLNDITRRKMAEEEKERSIEFFRLINECRDLDCLVRDATDFFQKKSGCEAVGIRLKLDYDYPYYEIRGFSDEFIFLENTLYYRGCQGQPVVDGSGEPVLEGMCGQVISGQFDPSKPWFTEKGSFWTNSTTGLLAALSDSERPFCARNRCSMEGYESIALIAISMGTKRLGLIQLNDRRKGVFTPESISFFERLSENLAIAVSKFAAEEELRQSREDMERAQEVGQIGSWRLNVMRNILTWSDENHAIFGVPKGTQMNYETFLGLVHPDDREYVDNKWKAGLRGEPYNIEHRINSDGRTKWVREKAYLEFGRDGSLIGGFGITQDITERKQAEEALRWSEADFRLLSETAEHLIMWKDIQSVVNNLCKKTMEHLDCQVFFNYLVNKEAGRLHLNAFAGISDEEAGKIAWLDFGVAVCGCTAVEESPIIAENIFTSQDQRTELVKSFGIQAYACHPLRIQGKVIGTLSFGTRTRTCFSDRDIFLMERVTAQVATAMERSRLLDEQQKLREGLEAKVRERTADLEKYIEALSQSNMALEDFAHVASHDLQEPLRKIMTFAERLTTLKNSSMDNQAIDYLYRMQQAAARMQSLIQDLLKYSRVTSSARRFKSMNLRLPLEDAVRDLSVLIEDTQGQIVIDELPDVEGDRIQLSQLFVNLINNSLKYRSRERPMIRISCNPPSAPGFCEIQVKDNGIGFDELYVDRIFKPFQRLHGRSSPFQGTGMGLAICRKILEIHGGSITARSKPGSGSTFIIRLPKAQAK